MRRAQRPSSPGPRAWTRQTFLLTARATVLLLMVLLLAGCADPPAPQVAGTATATNSPATRALTTEPAVSATAPPRSTATATATLAPLAAVNRGPFSLEEPHCGVLLPLIAPATEAQEASIGASSSADLQQIPQEARPAVEQIMAHPQSAGLAAFEVGKESEGVYLNASTPLPLASVVKVVHLVAYAQAVQEGTLDPATVVPLSDLDAFYLPNSDLGAHPRAVATLREEDRLLEEPPAVLLEDVPRMMIEFSSNAATDYLHMLLGQERIEQTVIDLGLSQHTAPCPFLGQFLLMGNGGDVRSTVGSLLEDPQTYSRQVLRLTQAFSSDVTFREDTGGWFGRRRRPQLETQQDFSEYFNAHGTAGEYATLMAQIATNRLGPWEQNVRIRRYLEWPTAFPANQEKLAWLGYKGGSLPAVLTVVYYAQPWHTTEPVAVALFFHDLPLETYRQWRRTLPHDELARWLLREPQAIPALKALLGA